MMFFFLFDLYKVCVNRLLIIDFCLMRLEFVGFLVCYKDNIFLFYVIFFDY